MTDQVDQRTDQQIMAWHLSTVVLRAEVAEQEVADSQRVMEDLYRDKAVAEQRVSELTETLREVRSERHHWCTEGQVISGTPKAKTLGCSCPKAKRDERIDAVLARVVVSGREDG